MHIILKLDYFGKPYILLKSKRSTKDMERPIEDETLKYFIRKAFSDGIEIVNEPTNRESINDYTTIRLKNNKELNDQKESEFKDNESNNNCTSPIISDEELYSGVPDFDYVAKMPPKARYKVTVKVKKVEKIDE